MYVPHRYRVDDEATIEGFLRAHGFGLLVTASGGVPTATHLPIELVTDDGPRRLEGHWARANPQWRSLRDGDLALAVFAGPHAYVTPAWYDHENVPTWNYQAVHASGPVEIVHDPAVLLGMVRRLARHHEPAAAGAFDVDRMTPSLREAELSGIVGFRLHVERLEAAFKLSQNRDEAGCARVVAGLRRRAGTLDAEVADAMEAACSGRNRRPGSAS